MGQFGLHFGHLRRHGLAEVQKVAALGHRHRKTDRRFAIHAEHRRRRVGGNAGDGGQINQRHEAVIHPDFHRAQAGFGRKGARDAQRHLLLGKDHRARRGHRVLPRQGIGDGLHVDPVSRKPGRRELDQHLFLLHADQVDLAHIRHAQNAPPRGIHRVAQLGHGKPFGGEAVDDPESIAEFIVEDRADHALRQKRGQIAHLLAHLIPDIRHHGGRRVIAQVDEDHRLAGAGIAVQPVQMRGLLQLVLQPVGDKVHHVRARSAGPIGRHDHGLDGEGRVLVARQVHVAEGSGHQRRDHQKDHERPVGQRPGRQVELCGAGHCAASHRVTSWPGRSLLTPAVTTMSPAARLPDSTAASAS